MKQCGTLVFHILQDLKVPCSNFVKDYKFIELKNMRDLLDSNYTITITCYIAVPSIHSTLMIQATTAGCSSKRITIQACAKYWHETEGTIFLPPLGFEPGSFLSSV